MHSHISSTACHVSETYTIACEAMDKMYETNRAKLTVLFWKYWLTSNSYAANSKLSNRAMEDIVSKTDVELRTHFRELPSHLRLPASPKVLMLPHVCLFQYVARGQLGTLQS